MLPAARPTSPTCLIPTEGCSRRIGLQSKLLIWAKGMPVEKDDHSSDNTWHRRLNFLREPLLKMSDLETTVAF